MTNKELKQAIKNKLVKAGFEKGYTISVRNCGYSTMAKITVNNPKVNRLEIEKIANSFEEYERDIDYEILQGGNTYIRVEWKDGIFDEVAQEWAATARGAMDSKDETTAIFDGLYLIDWEHSGRLEIRQQNKKDHCHFNVYSLEQLATFIYKFATFGTIAA